MSVGRRPANFSKQISSINCPFEMFACLRPVYIFIENGDNSDAVVREIYNHVDPEIRKDLNAHLKSKNRLAPHVNNVFSQKPYHETLQFNSFIGFGPTIQSKYSLYEGGLGQGYFLYIYYIKPKRYSIELTDGHIHTPYFESDDWGLIKEKLDTYFKSLI